MLMKNQQFMTNLLLKKVIYNRADYILQVSKVTQIKY